MPLFLPLMLRNCIHGLITPQATKCTTPGPAATGAARTDGVDINADGLGAASPHRRRNPNRDGPSSAHGFWFRV
ncbi:hypothetical protein BJY04DRAFT_219372 [Aspergillus karnatakaensis]|uniref:uncharacterized protein n=1 Tax=Aspergillus karnatakaensis TaxID=1810916 RepID=UPI003CCD7AAF